MRPRDAMAPDGTDWQSDFMAVWRRGGVAALSGTIWHDRRNAVVGRSLTGPPAATVGLREGGPRRPAVSGSGPVRDRPTTRVAESVFPPELGKLLESAQALYCRSARIFPCFPFPR